MKLQFQSSIFVSGLLLFPTGATRTDPPSVTPQPTPTPTISPQPTYSEYSSNDCASSWQLGTVTSDRCYSYDTHYCTFYYKGCSEVTMDTDYYNVNDFTNVWGNRANYGSVMVSVTACDDPSLDSCEIKVEDANGGSVTCTCTNSGKFVTLVSCPSLPSNSIKPIARKTINAEGGLLEIENVDELDGQKMCTHASVTAQRSTTRSFNFDGIPSKPVAGGSTKTFSVPAIMEIWVHEGVDAFDIDIEPGIQEQFLTKTIQFLMSSLTSANSPFATVIQNVWFNNIEVSAISEDELEAEFIIKVEMNADSVGSGRARELLNTLAGSDWNHWIQIFRETSGNSAAVANVLSRISRVNFKAIGRGDLDEADESNQR